MCSTLVSPTLNEGQNSSKSHKNRCPCLSLKWVSKSTFKTQFLESKQKCIFEPWFDQPWTREKITPNLVKIRVHAYLSNGYINPLSKLYFEKVDKSASFQPWFDQPWMRAKIAPKHIKIGGHACLSKWVPKSTFKTQFRESEKKVHIFNLGLTNLEQVPK